MRHQISLKLLLLCVFLMAGSMALLKMVFDPAFGHTIAAGVEWRIAAGVLAGMVLAAAIAAPLGWMGAKKKYVGAAAFIACFVIVVLCTVHTAEWMAIGLPRGAIYEALYRDSVVAGYMTWGYLLAPFAAGFMAWLMVRITALTRRTTQSAESPRSSTVS
jgi:hypothetical protein